MIISSGWSRSGDGGTLKLDDGNIDHSDQTEKKKSKIPTAPFRR
jgi:hypothetical protein